MNKKFLEKWIRSTGKNLKDLQKMWEQIEADVEQTYPDKSSAEKDRLTKQLFGKQARRSMYSKSKAETFFGFILGASRRIDIAEFMRRKALRAYREDPVQAQLEGMVDEAGTPLDPREKIGNRDNPNFHKPMTGHIWNRKVFGIVKKEGTKNPMLFIMTLWRGTAKNFRYKPFIAVEFKALLKSMDKGYFRLNPSKLTKFQATRRSVDFEKWLREIAEIVPLSDLKAVAKKQTGYDNWVFTEGDVDLINPTVNPNTDSRSIVLSDAESGMIETVRIFIPSDFPIGFSELSRVLVLGNVRLWRREGESEDRVSMEGFSIFPLPGQTMEQTTLENEVGMPATQDDDGPLIEFIEEPED